MKYLEIFKENLEKGIDLILDYSKKTAYPNENLKSIPEFVEEQHQRLKELYTSQNELQFAVNF